MSPEAMRIAIATACGWQRDEDGWWNGRLNMAGERRKLPPNYPEDLNAIHSAEEVLLSQGLQDHWLDTLVEVVVGKNVHWSDYHCFPQVNRATAAQRCEAFLKTLGLWKEDAP